MAWIKPFNELSRHDANIAGGKGASLGEMTQAGIPVPPGFVILSEAFERFLEETDLNVEIDSILHTVKPEEMHTVEGASEKIQALILAAKMPEDIKQEIQTFFAELDAKYVAVRSSATAEDSASAAWAGQLDSFLNTTEDTLLENVQHCWASLFTPRAIFYRFEKELHQTKISVAVVVQKMVESEVSGIAFSVHPVTEDRNQLIIEAGYGLGEAIVSGSVTPDSYVVEKEPRRIIDTNVSTQTRALYRVDGRGPSTGSGQANVWRDIAEPQASSQVLTETQILELSELILKIENHYGFPCDIEWAFAQGAFYIVQSRPITTLSEPKSKDVDDGVIEKIKSTDCQNDWEGMFSLLHLSFAGKGYFEKFKEIFGKNIDFVYVVYKDGVASAYLPINSYEEVGTYLAEKMRDHTYLQKNTVAFKNIADEITSAIQDLSFENLLDNTAHIQSLYDTYTAYQVATKTAANFLDPQKDSAAFTALEETRKYSENFFGTADKKINEIIKSASATFKGYAFEEISFLTLEELLASQKKDDFPSSANLLKRRTKCGIYLSSSGTGLRILDADVVDQIEQQWFSSVSTKDGIKGTIGYPGVVRGKCRVIADYESAVLDEGDILVTGMTDPNFVPLMKKAGAIVTDGGGLLCHAAIIAREMNKPCIIGTKFATQVLKDGDLVEVDADNGVVRILETYTGNEIHFQEGLPEFIMDTVFLASRPQTVQRDEAVYMFLQEYGLQKTGVVSIPLEGNNRSLHLSEEMMNALYEKVIEAVDSKEKLTQHLKRYQDLVSKYEEAITTFAHVGSGKEDIKNAFILFERLCVELSDYVWVPFAIEKVLDPLFIERLNNEFGSEAEEMREAISSPTQLHEYQKMRIAICDCVISGQDISQASQGLADQFGWYGEYSYVEDLYDEKYFESELKKLTPDTAHKEREDLFEGIRHNTERYTQMLEKITNPTTRVYAELINHYVFLRTDRVDLFKKIQTPFRNVFKMLADNLVQDTGERWSMREVVSMTNQEILSYLNGSSVPNKDEMARRVFRYVYYRSPEETRVITDEKEMEVVSKLVLHTEDSDGPIKGMSAFKGIAIGKVALVYGKSDLGKVTSKSVLVARTTMVDYISAMERAVAFVTEEGGVTSHAAIIARELKKPCIVGTGNCTKVLKDGDLVEVDADNGVVRILEKSTNGNTEMVQFEKTIERDTTFLMQGIYGAVMAGDNYLSLGKGNPYRPVVIHATTGDNVQIWENKKAVEWFLDALLEENKKGIGFMQRIVDSHREVLENIQPYWEGREFSDPVKMAEYVALVELGNANISLIYYAGNDERTPQEVKDLAIEIRKDDEFFARNDAFARERVVAAGYDSRIAEVVLPHEFVTLPPEEDLRARLSGAILLDGRDLETVSLTVFAEKHPEYEFNDLITNAWDGTEISGQTACAGRARGPVRIVKNRAQAQKVKEGDIIVSPMTTPDFIDAMHRSAAFVTDEGGIVCHAAIVAREMKKPCIIGTKIATQVLKDGDLVEVDADNGVVRIIEQKKPVLEKYLERLFMLATFQIWNRAEKTSVKAWTSKSQPADPYVVFDWDGTSTTCWYDFEGINWVKEELQKRIVEDPSFLAWILKEAVASYDKLRPAFESKTPLALSGLSGFIKDATYAWNILEATWFLIENAEEHGEKSDELTELLAVRKYGEKLVPEIDRVLHDSFTHAYPHLGTLVSYILIDEVMNGSIPSEEVLAARAQKYCLAQDTLYAGESAEELGARLGFDLKRDTISSISADGVLKGVCAQPGHAQGIVRIVKSRHDISKCNEGDILVSPMSLPDFMPAMIRCAAIVTDEGGLVSHAAITSRELKKPCVMATKIATQVLHDGDLVEVDADNGVVRIIEKYEH